jgi:hypothetical protein
MWTSRPRCSPRSTAATASRRVAAPPSKRRSRYIPATGRRWLSPSGGAGPGDGYADGAFIAFHGSWNRAPLPQAGFRVIWQPLAGGKASKPFTTFATGTSGETSLRPSGLAIGPDGSLYIAADANGTIWRIVRSPDVRAQAATPVTESDGPAVGDTAPDFALPAATREGVAAGPVRLSDFRGKTVVLAFFFKARTKG